MAEGVIERELAGGKKIIPVGPRYDWTEPHGRT